MNRVTLVPELAFALRADIKFEVAGPLHAYGGSA